MRRVLSGVLVLFLGAVAVAQSSAPVLSDLEGPLTWDGSRLALLGEASAGDDIAALVAARPDLRAARPLALRGWWLVELTTPATSAVALRQLADSVREPAGAAFVSPVFVGRDGGPVIVTQQLLIGLTPGVTRADARALLSTVGAPDEEALRDLASVQRVATGAADGFDVLARVAALTGVDGVRFVEPAVICTGHSAYVPNDPDYGNQWALNNTGQNGGLVGFDLNAEHAWDVTLGDGDIIVVVIDTGVEQGHPDIHQVGGADFTGEGGGGGPVNGCDNHGTAVAGCVSARRDNAFDGVGIAPDCVVASARPFVSTLACNGSWTTNTSWTVDALQWATQIGARVTNNSNFYGFSAASIESEYTATRNAGMVHFAAAGNGGVSSAVYPANLPTVNAILALRNNGQRASFSNFGPDSAFGAPGENVLSTDRSGSAGYEPGTTVVVSGTSFASPYAAGVAALMLSADASLDPAAIEHQLKDTARDLGAPGFDEGFGFGLVDAHAALVTPPDPWLDLGGGRQGAAGIPLLQGAGSLASLSPVSLTVTSGPPSEPALLWIAISSTPLDFLGGTLWAFPFAEQLLLFTDLTGTLALAGSWPPAIPADTPIWFQTLHQDLTAVGSIIMSNGVVGTTP